ncbi:alpha/beta hydrolase family protein [Aliidiomarina sp. Khilg15.8]
MTLFLRAIAISTLMLAGLSFPATATTVNYDATCYSAPNDDYDNLIDSWVERNRASRLDRDYFEKQLARSEFERMRSTVDCRWLVYQQGAYQVGAFMLRPYDREQTSLPVIIYNRGGQGPNGRLTFRELITDVMPFVEAGFLVIGSQYLGGGGVFPGMRNGTDEFGGADLESVTALMGILEREAQADVTRIGLLGFGRGAMMSFLVADKDPRFKAIASVGGLTDLPTWAAERASNERVLMQYVPEYEGTNKAPLETRSVLHNMHRLPAEMPVLLLHGGRDRKVDPNQSERLAAALAERGQQHKLILYERGDHSLNRMQSRMHEQIIAWFDTHL